MKNQVIEYGVKEAVIADLKAKSEGLTVTNPAERKEIMVRIGQVKKIRVAVGKRRKELKKDVLKLGNDIDDEAGRITDLLLEVETPLLATRDKYDAKKAAEKAEKERKEQERLKSIQNKIDHLNALPIKAVSQKAEDVKKTIDSLIEYVVTKDIFAEFAEEAERIRLGMVEKLTEMYVSKLEQEETDKRLAKEREELAAQRKADDEKAAKEREKQEAQRKADEEKAAEERKEIQEAREKLEAERKVLDAEKLARTEPVASDNVVSVATSFNITEDGKVSGNYEEIPRLKVGDWVHDGKFAGKLAKIDGSIGHVEIPGCKYCDDFFSTPINGLTKLVESK